MYLLWCIQGYIIEFNEVKLKPQHIIHYPVFSLRFMKRNAVMDANVNTSACRIRLIESRNREDVKWIYDKHTCNDVSCYGDNRYLA